MPVQIIDRDRLSTSSQAVFFYDASYRGLLFAGGIFAVIAGYIAIPKDSGINFAAAIIPGILALLLATGAFRRKFMRSDCSWIMAIDTTGVYLNLGYNTGYGSGKFSDSALFLPQDAICFVRKSREVMRLPHRFGATRHHFGYLDIVLSFPISDEALLAMQAANELFGNAGKSGPFPMRFVTPLLLRLNLNAVIPGEKEALEYLSHNHKIGNMVKVCFPEWDEITSGQRDIYLEELWEMGMWDEAAFLARTHLKAPLKKARERLAENCKARRDNPGD